MSNDRYNPPSVDQSQVEAARAQGAALWRVISKDHWEALAHVIDACPRNGLDRAYDAAAKLPWAGFIERIDTATGRVSGAALPV